METSYSTTELVRSCKLQNSAEIKDDPNLFRKNLGPREDWRARAGKPWCSSAGGKAPAWIGVESHLITVSGLRYLSERNKQTEKERQGHSWSSDSDEKAKSMLSQS